MDDDPPPYDSHDFDNVDGPSDNEEEYSEDENGPSDNARPDSISGLYNIVAHEHETMGDFRLSIDYNKGQLWGQFAVGPKIGVLRVDDITGLEDGDITTFGWRSEDEETGRLKFGRGCDGSFAFEGGKVHGRFVGLMDGEDVDFDGRWVFGDTRPGVEVLKSRWDDFPRKAYGRA